MATDCGFTPAQVREMTLWDVGRIHAGWRRFPPARVFMAALAGFKPQDEQPMTQEEFRVLFAAGGQVPGLGRR